MADRGEYMRDYMRAWRKRKAKERSEGRSGGGLSEDRLRAIIREELALALRPFVSSATTTRSTSSGPPLAPPATTATGQRGVTAKKANVNNVNSAAAVDPIPYRRPNPDEPSDPRCQAKNRDGSRCRAKGEVVAIALDNLGRRGEFSSCRRHGDGSLDFHPHPSVLASFK